MKYFLGLLLPLFLCYSYIKKDDCSERVSKPINEILVKSIPYFDGQVVVFKTNKPETITTVVERKFQILQPDSPLICEEYLEVNLRNIRNNTNFINFLIRGYPGSDSLVQFGINPYDEFSNTIQYVIHADGKMNSVLLNAKSVFHDVITINNTSYAKVLELNWENQDDSRFINHLFYNTKYGVLRYETKDGLVGNLVSSNK
jgi:hypothetical protein